MDAIRRSAFLASVLGGVCLQPAGAGEAEQVFNSLYGQEYRKVQSTRDRADDVALAKQLIEATRTAADQPELLALLCERACQLTERSPAGYATAIEAMKRLAAKVPARREGCRTKVLELYQRRYNASSRDDRPAIGQELMGYLVALADEDAGGKDYSSAVRYLRRASFLARSIQSPAGEGIAAKLKHLIALERTDSDIRQMKSRLKASPGSAAVRSRLVWLYLVEKDDPNEAAKYLSAGCDEACRTYLPLVGKDAASLADRACLELADWYRSLSLKSSGAAKPAMLSRAKGYYEMYLSKHATADISRTKAELALKKVAQELGAAEGVPTAPRPVPGVRLRPRAGKGSPFGAMALVSRPGAVTGGAAWTIETRRPRAGLEAVAFSADGKQLAIACRSGMVRICDAATGNLVRILAGHDGCVHDVAYSPDGTLLASASADKTVRAWDARTGRCHRVLKGHKGAIYSIAWAPDGKMLVSGSADKTAAMWYPRTGKLRGMLPEHKEPVYCVDWSPNGKWLAVGSAKEANVWTTGGRRRDVVERGNTVWALTWSADSQHLAFGGKHSRDEGVRIWHSGYRRSVKELTDSMVHSTAMAWSPDGKRLAAQGRDGTVQVWDTATWKVALSLTAMGKWASSEASSGLAWSRDGKWLAVCGNSHRNNCVTRVGVWSAETGRNAWMTESQTARITAMAYTSKAGRIAYCSRRWDERPLMWLCSARTGQMLVRREMEEGEGRTMAWSRSGKLLAGGFSTHLMVWDADANSVLHNTKGEGREVEGVSWSPDGKVLAECHMTAQPRLFDAASGRVLKELAGKEGAATDMEFSPDGKWLAVATHDDGDRVYMWEPGARIAPDILTGHRDGVYALAWGPESKRLATASSDRTVRLWAISPCRPLRTLSGHLYEVSAVAWSPDGKTVASGDCPRVGRPEIRLWDAERGELLSCLGGHTGEVVELAWSADGRLLASAGKKLIRLWDVQAGLPAMTLLAIDDTGPVAIGAGGHLRAPKGMDLGDQFVYVVQTSSGPETMSPSDFAAKYGWKNDPAKVGR